MSLAASYIRTSNTGIMIVSETQLTSSSLIRHSCKEIKLKK